MSDKPESDPKPKDIPALFATIHFRSEERPNGYSDEDIAELNDLANGRSSSNPTRGKDPA